MIGGFFRACSLELVVWKGLNGLTAVLDDQKP